MTVLEGPFVLDILRHMRLLPGRALVKRKPGHWWGEIVCAPGFLMGERVGFDPQNIEAHFQKGKSCYAILLVKNIRRERGGPIL
jgi:hypothetical protein